MASFNRVIIIGNLTRDPELKYTAKGQAILKITIACNRKWKTDTGEQKDEVTFVDVTAWGKAAEIVAQYSRKGKSLMVEGRLHAETWDDKTTGQKRHKMGVVMESFQFLDSGEKGEKRELPQKEPYSSILPLPKVKGAEVVEGVAFPPEDDVPF